MTKRKPSAPKPIKLSKRVQDYASERIAAGIVRGTNRFIVAGCTVLQRDYGFTDQMILEFAEKTKELGNKYLRIAPNDQTTDDVQEASGAAAE